MSHLRPQTNYRIYSKSGGYLLQKTPTLTGFGDIHEPLDYRVLLFSKSEAREKLPIWQKFNSDSEVIMSFTKFEGISNPEELY